MKFKAKQMEVKDQKLGSEYQLDEAVDQNRKSLPEIPEARLKNQYRSQM